MADLYDYLGHKHQLRGAEQITLNGGKGNGMKYIIIRNGKGLEAWISVDRACDLTRLYLNGVNLGYFSPCGHVSPQYCENSGTKFLNSFTAGFFTTAGLLAVGSPCIDEGQELPLHGTISSIPADNVNVIENDDGIEVAASISDSVIFAQKLVLQRKYYFSYYENTFTVTDTVTNESFEKTPYMILYHCNMGYPLLSENSRVVIPSKGVVARNNHANEYISSSLEMQEPTAGYEECCYYYDVKDKNGISTVGIYNPDVEIGMTMKYKKNSLPCFTQWKMMGKRDYVLGLEPGNCTPDGRDVLRQNGTLKFIEPYSQAQTELTFVLHSNKESFEGEF